MKKIIFLFFIFFSSTNIALSQNKTIEKYLIKDPFEDIKNWKGKKTPHLTIKKLSNERIKGKIVVINLWATTCHPCLEEIPLLNKLVDIFKNEDVLFYAASPEDPDKIKYTLEENNFKYTILANAQEIFTRLGLVGYPYNIVIDRKGIIRYISTGTVDVQGRKIASYELPLAIAETIRSNSH